MTEPAPKAAVSPCATCGTPLQAECVRVTLTRSGKLVLLENVPAQVCSVCQEQYYDEETSEKILRWIRGESPEPCKVHEITVPVFAFTDLP